MTVWGRPWNWRKNKLETLKYWIFRQSKLHSEIQSVISLIIRCMCIITTKYVHLHRPLYELSKADTECILFGRSGLLWATATQHNTQTAATYPSIPINNNRLWVCNPRKGRSSRAVESLSRVRVLDILRRMWIATMPHRSTSLNASDAR